MDSLRTTDFGRSSLTYSLEGMPARDEMLFKSLVRLLDHLTTQKWTFRPASADYRVDLLVVSEWYPPTLYRNDHPAPQPVMSIGKGVDRDLYLSWPVQPQRLQIELNRIGDMAILHQLSDSQVPFVPVFTGADGEDRQIFRLKRWPASRYLVGVGRMRMATLLAGKPMSMQELQHRSAMQLSLCRSFVSDLQSAKLLVVTVAEAPAAGAAPAVLEPHLVLNLTSSAVAFAKPGLLARIRSGLGL